MSGSQWPEWARQDETPVAVMNLWSMWRRPDGDEFMTALYADGTVMRHPTLRPVECQTAEFVRQVIASMDFPDTGMERFEWEIARTAANASRNLPAPAREREGV